MLSIQSLLSGRPYVEEKVERFKGHGQDFLAPNFLFVSARELAISTTAAFLGLRCCVSRQLQLLDKIRYIKRGRLLEREGGECQG